MKKIKTSAKNIKSQCPLVLGVGYCEIQKLLRKYRPQFYNAGHSRWNCDYYEIIPDNVGIVIGYKTTYCETVNLYKLKHEATEILKNLEEAMIKISDYNNVDRETDIEKIDNEFREFLLDVKNGVYNK